MCHLINDLYSKFNEYSSMKNDFSKRPTYREMESQIYYGQIKCQEKYKSTGLPCRNNAYYSYNNKYLCGIHSNKNERVELPKNNKAKRESFEKGYTLHLETVDQAAKENKVAGKSGQVICSKMLMMKGAPLVKGFLNVFPNYKHQNRKDGFGCMSLSPKSMGPIEHNQVGLPICKNLENFHQGNKVFPSELDSDGKILPSFYELQKKMYEDPIPHRHKQESYGNNVPRFSVWKSKDHVEKHFTYIESRQFYCNYYERFALKDSNFLKLKEKLKEGINLNICGYDAYEVSPNDNIEKLYLDKSRPFGHEMVLYTLLTQNESDWPWRKYKTEDF